MTRFNITMDEALDFILKASILGKGSEVFVPKLRAYDIMDLKTALDEIINPSKEEIIGIRPGEKLHEVLINSDEMRYSWELDEMYLLANPFFPSFSPENVVKNYQNAKKMINQESYSSNNAPKISPDELKKLVLSSSLLKEKLL